MIEYVLRFLIGGVAVSLFALVGALVRPKSFAGLFGAAPSIALATLAMALSSQDANYIVQEGRAMMIGAAALCLYAILACHLLLRGRFSAMAATAVALAAWFAVAGAGRYFLAG